jgi:polar amino acid transport system permease protein
VSAPDSWTPSPAQREREAVRRRLRLRSTLLSAASAVVFFGVLVAVVVTSPGWPTVRETFFDWDAARDAFPEVLKGFWLNVRLFLVAEPLILVLGLAVAAARVSTSPLLVPVRLVAVGYTDLFRGLPTILVVFLVCFGVPTLQLQGVTSSLFWLALVALVLSYGAYVAEVFRAGIESVHPSQVASATVAAVGLFDALGTASDTANFTFNFTPYVVAAAFFVGLTVPLARLTDWIGRRTMERERAGAR